MSPGRPRPPTSRFRITRIAGLGVRLRRRLGQLPVLFALAELHLPREDRRRDRDDAHERQRADHREERLDRAEDAAARVALPHCSPPCSRLFRTRSSVARSSLARLWSSDVAESRSRESVSSRFAMRAMCSSTTSGGAFRMNQSRPKISTARSSSSPITGMKSGMRSSGNTRYAAIPASTAFCSSGTRGSRARPHTRRAYVGSLRAVSIASPIDRGRLMPLATVDLPLREPCPQCRDRRRRRRITVGRPERDQVVRLALGDAAELDRRSWFTRDAGGFLQRGAYLVGADRLLAIVDDEPERAAPCRKAREVHDGARHEHRVRHDDLAVVRRLQHRRAERDLLDDAGLATAPDGFADAEGPLHQDPDAGEEVLEDVLKREADDEADHAERGEDPAEGVPGVDREHAEDPEHDDEHLREIPEEDRDVRLSATTREHAHGR